MTAPPASPPGRAGSSALARRIDRAADRVLDGLVDLGFGAAMRLARGRYWPAFERASHEPAAAQDRVLRSILGRNAATSFGRDHGFDRIDTIDVFRCAVPIQDYESLRPAIEEQELTGARTLTVERPVIYAQTSGTSGAPKYVPMTAAGVERVGRAQRLFAAALHRGTGMFGGKIVGIGSPAIEGHLPGGTPYGSASGMVYEQMPSVVRRKYVLGPEVLAIDDHDTRYEVIAALCLAEGDVTGVATANPSTLLRLRTVMADRWDDLVDAVATGVLPFADRLDDEQLAAVRHSLPGDPSRADELRSMGRRSGSHIGFADIWPRLAAVSTWTGGSAGFALSSLAPFLHPTTAIAELGYSASEVRGTIGVDPTTNLCAPLVTDNLYEFVACADRDSVDGTVPADRFQGLHELEPGGRYYVYVTTFDGLYRYDMNDIVEVTGRFGATPTLAFVQKGRGVTNITGEKLSESQVIAAVETARRANGIVLTFFVALADEEAAAYRLYVEVSPHASPTRGCIEQLAADVDEELARLNVEYRSKRSSGRLGPMVGVAVEQGTADAYRRACVASGQRDAQFKFLFLQYRAQCTFDFERRRATPRSA